MPPRQKAGVYFRCRERFSEIDAIGPLAGAKAEIIAGGAVCGAVGRGGQSAEPWDGLPPQYDRHYSPQDVLAREDLMAHDETGGVFGFADIHTDVQKPLGSNMGFTKLGISSIIFKAPPDQDDCMGIQKISIEVFP